MATRSGAVATGSVGAAQRALQSPGAEAADPAVPRPRVRRLRRLHRPGQLRHQHRRRLEVRLHALLGDPRLEPDGDADPDALGQARDRHRPQPARGLPRQLLAPHLARALGPGRADRDGDRPGRVPRRGARAAPALRDGALPGRADHRRRHLPDPRPAALRPARLRGGDRRLRGRDRHLLPGRALLRPPAARHGRAALGQAGVRGQRVGAARGRDPRRDGDAARDLPPLRADAEPRRPAQRLRGAGASTATRRSTS